MAGCENQIRLDAYHDGELSAAERLAVEAHLCSCPSCAAELAAMREISGAFAIAPHCGPSHEQLLQVAHGVRAGAYDARMLARLFRRSAIAASVLLVCTLLLGRYLSQRTKAAAHEAIVLDQVATWSYHPAVVADAPGERRPFELRVAMAQWIADDLHGR